MDIIVNKVAESGIVTLDLAVYLPAQDAIAAFDMKPFLFRELILKEKDFREALKNNDWSPYAGKHIAIFCSADAVIPMWAYMLVASYLQPVAASMHYGSVEELYKVLVAEKIATINVADYADKRVVLKGCGDISVPEIAYILATQKLRPVVKSLMFGEPCSTVPIYKQAKQ